MLECSANQGQYRYMRTSSYSLVFSSAAPKGSAECRESGNGLDGVITLSFRSGQSIAQAVYLSGMFQPPVLCSGLARCGRCRMRVEIFAPDPLPPDREAFSPDELAQGWRLACRHAPREGMRVALPEGTALFGHAYSLPADTEFSGGDAPLPDESHACAHVLAVDLGTTSLQWRLLEVEEPGDENGVKPAARLLWEGAAVNPQMGAGSDVVSRLAAAMIPGGGERLRDLVQAALTNLLDNASAFMPEGKTVSSICLAANSAMTSLALGRDIMGLARAPYSLPITGGSWESLPGLPPIWLPPQLSPFVGGDISAGYAGVALDPEQASPEYPFLIADLGTNGEFLLALSPDEAYAASVALGPALEGTGLSRGTEARAGAVAAFSLGPRGLAAVTLPDASVGSEGAPCPGITGTGYISLLASLIRAGVLGRDGHFLPDGYGPLAKFFTFSSPSQGGEPGLELPLGLRLAASDVEELLKVKAAFSLGLQRLMARAGITTGELARVYVAGALGLHVDKNALEELGFFPQGMAARVEAVGNSSLAGAALLLRFSRVREELVRWAAKVKSLELARDAEFLLNFPKHMIFSWPRALPPDPAGGNDFPQTSS